MSEPPALDLRLLLPCLTAWAIGAWALAWSGPARAGGAVAALALFAVIFVARTRHRGRHARASWHRDGPGVLALTLVATGLVLGASAAHEATRQVGPVTRLAQDGAMVTGEGVVLTEPLVRAGRPGGDEGGEPPARVILRVRLESVTARGVTSRVNAPVFIRADEAWTRVGWHDRITLTGKLSPADLAAPEVAALSPRGPPQRVGERSLVRSSAEHLRTGLREAVEPLPGDARALLPALVIGDRSTTPPELTDDMLVTGMSHLSAVSGTIGALPSHRNRGPTAHQPHFMGHDLCPRLPSRRLIHGVPFVGHHLPHVALIPARLLRRQRSGHALVQRTHDTSTRWGEGAPRRGITSPPRGWSPARPNRRPAGLRHRLRTGKAARRVHRTDLGPRGAHHRLGSCQAVEQQQWLAVALDAHPDSEPTDVDDPTVTRSRSRRSQARVRT